MSQHRPDAQQRTAPKRTPATPHGKSARNLRGKHHPGWVWYRQARRVGAHREGHTRGFWSVARAIAEHAIAGLKAWPSRQRLATVAGVSTKTVTRALAWLARQGLIHRAHRRRRSTIIRLIMARVRPQPQGRKLSDLAGIAWAAGLDAAQPQPQPQPHTKMSPRMPNGYSNISRLDSDPPRRVDSRTGPAGRPPRTSARSPPQTSPTPAGSKLSGLRPSTGANTPPGTATACSGMRGRPRRFGRPRHRRGSRRGSGEPVAWIW